MGFSKKTKAAVLAGAMTLGAVSGAYAYFSGTAETKSNVFNIVAGRSDQKDTAGTILEPGWNPANAVDLEPGQEVTKDPSLKSNVEYQSWAFLQVEIPAVTAQKKGDLSDQVYDAVVLNGIDGAKWEKIREDISGEPGTDSVYIYGLKDPLAHDRYFLDSVTSRIVELDKGKLYSYQGGYEKYLELKAERIEMAEATERKRQSILRTEIAWMQRGARARSTKQKAHIQRYEALRDQEGPQYDRNVQLESIASRLGRTTVELKDISKSYGDKVLLKDFTYIFLKNDRVGIIGPNGSGKSTLMKIIAGWVQPDSGTTEIGQTVKLGYFSQENEAMDESLRVIDYIKNAAEYVKTKDGSISASQMLERFLFPSSVQYTVIGKLSGGEKRRLYLLRILMEAPNVILLDEPTNDLDIQTLVILEDYLDTFPGIVITVSHDRYFLDRVVNRIFAFEGDGRVQQYEGGYTDYQNACLKRAEAEGGQPGGGQEGKTEVRTNGKTQRTRGPQKLKFSYKEQRDYETIEGEMTDLEERISSLEQEIQASAHDFVKLNQLMAEKEEAEAALEEKMERWMYLEELAAKIAEQ